MTEGEVVEAAGGDLLDRDHDLVVVRAPGDGDGRVQQPDPPGRRRHLERGEVEQGAVRSALGGEHGPVDHRVDGRQVDPRALGREDGDHVLGRARSGHRRQVVRPVDGAAVVDVVGAGDSTARIRAWASRRQLRGHPLHRAPWLDVGIEQVTGDQEQVHLLRDRQVDAGAERRELALALGRSSLAEISMASAEVDVRGVEQSEHAVGLPPNHHRRRDGHADRVPRAAAPPRRHGAVRLRALVGAFGRPRDPVAIRAPPSLPSRHAESRRPL